MQPVYDASDHSRGGRSLFQLGNHSGDEFGRYGEEQAPGGLSICKEDPGHRVDRVCEVHIGGEVVQVPLRTTRNVSGVGELPRSRDFAQGASRREWSSCGTPTNT